MPPFLAFVLTSPLCACALFLVLSTFNGPSFFCDRELEPTLKRVFERFDPESFPLLKEMSMACIKWPTSEHEVRKSKWIPLSEVLRSKGIKLTNEYGVGGTGTGRSLSEVHLREMINEVLRIDSLPSSVLDFLYSFILAIVPRSKSILAVQQLSTSLEAATVAAACVWLTNTLRRGLGALYFIGSLSMLCLLLKDAYNWLSQRLRRASSTPAPGPIALEDGTAAPPADATNANEDANALAPAPSSVESLIPRVCLSIALALSFAIMCWKGDGISLKRPLPENLRNSAVFLFDAFQVLLVLFIVLALVVLKDRLAAAWRQSSGAIAESAR
ncbi:hypothetical protein B0H19DRAFT_1349669 [Mycena capillaripes]|nr:hypothetical protein B0H19DRAFT_1349669 [Mycena capillaripes]